MTWILMEIPCHFMSKSTAVWSKLTPHSMTIPCNLSRFYFFVHTGTWHGFRTSSSHGIFMAFAKKMMGFPVRIWSHFRTKPNCHQYGMRKSVSHFLQGMFFIYLRKQQDPQYLNEYISFNLWIDVHFLFFPFKRETESVSHFLQGMHGYWRNFYAHSNPFFIFIGGK